VLLHVAECGQSHDHDIQLLGNNPAKKQIRRREEKLNLLQGGKETRESKKRKEKNNGRIDPNIVEGGNLVEIW
jgi:hypothetical protein